MESIVLDPVEVAMDRTELDLMADPISIRGPQGVEWGDIEVAAYMAEAERGESPVDFRYPNRQVTIPLIIEGTGFSQARLNLQAKVALIQREGGWLKRELADGSKLYLDIVNATLGMGGHTFQAQERFDNEIDLVLTTIPDWYGDEVELDDIVETSAPEIVSVLEEGGNPAVIAGDYPARCRIVVDEDDAERQFGLLWGVRSKNYSSASTAALAYQAEALTPLDSAAVNAISGSSGSGDNALGNSSLGSEWTPVLSTDLVSGGASLTHTGTYRVYARVWCSTSVLPDVRFAWGVGDLSSPVENAPFSIPASQQFYAADLGEIRLHPSTGTHRWKGVIQARGDGGGDLYVDKLWFVPIDEAAGKLSSPVSYSPGITGYTARDNFDQTSGNLSGKTLPVGGTWAGAGDADQFTIDTTNHRAQRTATSDTTDTGRYAIAGTATPSDVVASVYVTTTSNHLGLEQGLFVRYVDTSNWLKLSVEWTGDDVSFYLTKCVAGSRTILDFYLGAPVPYPALGIVFTLAVIGGNFIWTWQIPGFAWSSSGSDSVLATGGALDDGKVGIYDENDVATAATRQYDNFWAYVPNVDAVLHASQSAALTTEGIFREDTAGAAYGRVPRITGDLPRIPPSGLEERPVELFLKGSRGDFDQLSDSGIDDISAQVFYRPSWLTVPGT